GVESGGQGAPAVTGPATFGPNLSEVAYKLGTKAGDRASARLWLIQWVLNPNVHHPRTRMPVTHLNEKDAADVASWLLEQGKEWADGEGKQVLGMKVDPPKRDTLKRLARLLLRRTRSQQEVDDVLSDDPKANERAQQWLTSPSLRADSDEAMLRGELTDDKLKLFIGRKAIGRQGCFGCHNIPGFETSQPIGTPLNDAGKEDPEPLAFEDGPAYVHKTFNIVPSGVTKDELEKMRSEVFELRQKVKDRTATAEEKRKAQRLGAEVDKLNRVSGEKVSVDPGTGRKI